MNPSCLVSIIVPAYNKGSYVQSCIRSVLEQSVSDEIELIVVDDGSTDNTYSICYNIMAGKKNCQLIHQINQGVSVARNVGIQHANGKYISFLDADDRLEKYFVEQMLESRSSDLVVADFLQANAGDYKLNSFPVCVIENGSNIGDRIANKTYFPFIAAPWAKLFKKKVIIDNGIKFLHLEYGEDTAFVLTYLGFCKSVSFTNNGQYVNNIVENTISRRKVENMFEQLSVVANNSRLLQAKSEKLRTFMTVRTIKLVLMNDSDSYGNFQNIFQKIKESGAMAEIRYRNIDSVKDLIICILLIIHFDLVVYALFHCIRK